MGVGYIGKVYQLKPHINAFHLKMYFNKVLGKGYHREVVT